MQKITAVVVLLLRAPTHLVASNVNVTQDLPEMGSSAMIASHVPVNTDSPEVYVNC